MSNEKTISNEPAFSKAAFYHPDGGCDSPNKGLTKREYFAAMALQGLLSNPSADHPFSEVADDAVKAAEFLIERLNEEQK